MNDTTRVKSTGRCRGNPCGCPMLGLKHTLGDHKGTPLQEQLVDK